MSAVWGLLASRGTLPAGHMGIAGGLSTKPGIKDRTRPRWGQEVVGTSCLILIYALRGQPLQLPGQACMGSVEHLCKIGHPRVLLSTGAGVTVPHGAPGNWSPQMGRNLLRDEQPGCGEAKT